MGCAPSKRVLNDETLQYLREIEELKQHKNIQDKEISRLNEENKRLRYGSSYEDVTKLENEMEQLRVENKKLKQNKKVAEEIQKKLKEENATLRLQTGTSNNRLVGFVKCIFCVDVNSLLLHRY